MGDTGKEGTACGACAKWAAAVLALGVAFGAGALAASNSLEVRSPFAFGSDDEQVVLGSGTQPFEFAYIDSDRVAAYLAQLKGGNYVKQRVSQKLVKTASGEISVQSAIKVGTSSQREDFVEREVTPTTASVFVELERELGDDTGLFERFDEQMAAASKPNANEGADSAMRESESDWVEEGDFVSFEARIKPPVYLNPYLSVRYGGALKALFPNSGSPRQRRTAQARRVESRKFSKLIGGSPRAMIAMEKPLPGSDAKRIKYLMPLRMDRLTEERSLLRSGGGRFKVFGKVVRIFDTEVNNNKEEKKKKSFSYVDAPTRETWKHPIRNAPPELICRSYLSCVHESNPAKRRTATKEAREEMLEVLQEQTRVEGVGVVLLPIAIYK